MTMLRRWGQTGMLPRARPMTEINVIQSPEKLQRLRETLGIRQGHFLPSLNEGVQTVVILDDVTNRSGSQLQPAFASVQGQQGDAGTRGSAAVLFNPANSGVILRVKRVMVCPNPQNTITTTNFSLNLAFMTSPPVLADFPTSAAEFFQNTEFSHEGWPNLTQIKSPVGIVSGGRSAAVGVAIHRWVVDPNFPPMCVPHVATFEDFRLEPSTALFAFSNLVDITLSLSASFQWTEEPHISSAVG